MWNAAGRSSYDVARSDEGGASTDEATLNGDDDLTLTPDELALEDPLDEKTQAHLDTRNLGSRGASGITGTLRQWMGRRSHNYTAASSHSPIEQSEEAGSLLHSGLAHQERLPQPRWWSSQDTVSWLIWPLPSFTHRFFVKTAQKEEVHRSTDYLDGLRGVASLFVFFDHYLNGVSKDFMKYGYGEGNHYGILELPFLKVIYAGSAMVAIFFIVSGYVLSARCVVAMRQNKQEKVHSALTSMSFRRAIRLFMPSIAISFITLIITLFGFLEPPNPHWTLWTELHRYWMYLMEDLFKLWTWEIDYKGWYGHQLWTIPLEFKCSMVLFLFVLIVARCKVHVRFTIEALFIIYLFYRDRWDVALFIVGMALAEINIIHDERKQARENLSAAPATIPRRSRGERFIRQLPLWIILIVGFYLLGYPMGDAEHTPGYEFLGTFWADDWNYKWRFWMAIGAIMFTFSTSFLPGAQAVFTTCIARYLGKISYALYLVHEVMNRTIRLFLWHTFWKVLKYKSDEGEDLKFEGGWILGTILYVPMVIWAADIAWRAIDTPAVTFAKWFEGKCFKNGKQA